MDQPDPPQPPPNKGGFKGKRVKNRSLSRNRRRGSNNQKKRKIDDPPAEGTDGPAGEDAALTSNRPVTEDSIFQQTSKGEYADMLSKCQLELSTALAESAKKDAIIAKLSKKVEQLTQSTKAARGVAREAKEYAKSIEDSSQKTAKKLQVELALAEEKVAQSIVDFEQQEQQKELAVSKEQASLFLYF